MAKKYLFFAFIFACALFLSSRVVLASTTDGTISGYAWSSQIGWVNFGTTGGNAHITDSVVTGYAWNENIGWINLGATQSGVTNNAEGTLAGRAWSQGTGWINFSGVVVSSSGVFSGSATGDNSTNINFNCTNCNVTTDWRPASVRSSGGGGGGGRGRGTDTTAPQLQITSIKNIYTENEDVIIRGTTESNAIVSVVIDNSYGSFLADQNGNWLITFGRLSVGAHRVAFTPRDAVGNIGKTVSAEFLVKKREVVLPPPFAPLMPLFTLGKPLAPILRDLAQGLKNIIPKFFNPIEKNIPQVVITVPKIAPLALRGNFHYISEITLANLVLAPLPSDLKSLAIKLPQLGNTLKGIGIKRSTDIKKLLGANLKLPSLTETVLPVSKVAVGKFVQLKGIPIANLSETAKSKIPSEIIFAKMGGGLVDFNVALSINNKGKTQQTIKTIAGQLLQLVVRAEEPVKTVKGYITFKSKKYNQVSFQIPLNDISASLLFSNPIFSDIVALHTQISVEGSSVQVNSNAEPVPANSSEIERRLVISNFEYIDSGGGVHTASVQMPVVDGEYEIITLIDYQDEALQSKEIKLITLVDPEGYIYEKNGNMETRIPGAIVYLYWLNHDSRQYELWNAKDFQQEDPQITDQSGTYSFLVPNGFYYLKVDAPGYLSYDGKPFEVKEGSGIHMNIELKTKYWFLKIVDWKTMLLIMVIILLLYNFYKDRIRNRGELKKVT